MGKRPKNPALKDESPAEKFIRLANQRMGNALKYIGLVENLAGAGYASTSEQQEQIVTALQDAVDRVKDRFGGKPPVVAGFRLASNE